MFKYLGSKEIPKNKLIYGPYAGFPMSEDKIGKILSIFYKYEALENIQNKLKLIPKKK